MNPIIKALADITSLLDSLEIPYMVFGGIANSLYGNPRQTFDIDIKFFLKSEKELKPFIEHLSKAGKIIPANPEAFIKDTNVIPVDIHDVRIDLVFAELPFEKEAIQRSKIMTFFDVNIKTCTPEDLVIQKVISTREKDLADINYIIENMRNELDWNYMLKHCKDLSVFLDTPEIYDKVKSLQNG